jgi:hypothetical protein
MATTARPRSRAVAAEWAAVEVPLSAVGVPAGVREEGWVPGQGERAAQAPAGSGRGRAEWAPPERAPAGLDRDRAEWAPPERAPAGLDRGRVALVPVERERTGSGTRGHRTRCASAGRTVAPQRRLLPTRVSARPGPRAWPERPEPARAPSSQSEMPETRREKCTCRSRDREIERSEGGWMGEIGRFVGSRGSGSRGMPPRHWWGETQGEEAPKSVLGPDRVGGHEAELA